MAGAGDLEEDPALLLEVDLPVVEEAGDQRSAEVGDQFGGREPPVLHVSAPPGPDAMPREGRLRGGLHDPQAVEEALQDGPVGGEGSR
jgi:hypothetical protein